MKKSPSFGVSFFALSIILLVLAKPLYKIGEVLIFIIKQVHDPKEIWLTLVMNFRFIMLEFHGPKYAGVELVLRRYFIGNGIYETFASRFSYLLACYFKLFLNACLVFAGFGTLLLKDQFRKFLISVVFIVYLLRAFDTSIAIALFQSVDPYYKKSLIASILNSIMLCPYLIFIVFFFTRAKVINQFIPNWYAEVD